MSKPKTAQKFEISSIERQIVHALKQDVDSLAKQFVASESTSMDALADLFVEKEFSTIFLGRLSVAEFAEFVENLFLYCVRYAAAESPDSESRMGAQPSSAAADPYPSYVVAGAGANRAYDVIRLKLRGQKRTVRERIFGVYMCYCLYFLQPPNFVVPIRVTVREMEALHRLAHDVLLIDEHMEPLYCLHRLFDAGAFTVTPFEADFNPLMHRRFDAYDEEGEVATELSELELAEDFPLLNQLADDVTLKQLTSIHETYSRMKEGCRLPGVSQTSKDTTDVSHYVQKLLRETMAAFADECRRATSSNRGDGAAELSARSRRSRIRQNAYAAVAPPMHQSRRQRAKHDGDGDGGDEEADGLAGPAGRASTGAQPPMLPVAYARASPPKRARPFMSKRVKIEPSIEEPSGVDDEPVAQRAADRPNLRRSSRMRRSS